MAVDYQRYESSNSKILTIRDSSSTKAIIELEFSSSELDVLSHIERFEELAKSPELEISELFDKIREYAREHQQSMLELLGEHLLDDLPYSVGNVIKDYLESNMPQVEPGQVKYWATFDSGRSDISERIEEIIYGTDTEDEA